jgi:hypothetical protein
MGREALVSGFSMLDFLSHPDILKNVGAQALGYGFGVLTNRPIEPIKLLPPLISYGPAACDFITQVTGATRAERIATLAFLFSGTGLLSKTGDPVLNAGAGSFIFLLAEYVEAMSKSGGGGGGGVPFIMARPNRSLRRFTNKQHLQCQLAITGILIITVGCAYVTIFIAKNVRKFVKVKLKNALIKSSKIKLFKSKPKVKFIPVA